jgi:hypothetical protein
VWDLAAKVPITYEDWDSPDDDVSLS